MGMSAGGSGDGPSSEINVTPLVDVCLVLLIIFMVLTPRNVPEISVRVPPESKNKVQTQKNESIVIGLTKDGGVLLNRTPVDRGELGNLIQSRLKGRDPVVFVDFDDDVKYGQAVEVLDIAKRSGAEVLGVMKRKDEVVPDTLVGL
jgi:biopolymer transport protein ExbD